MCEEEEACLFDNLKQQSIVYEVKRQNMFCSFEKDTFVVIGQRRNKTRMEEINHTIGVVVMTMIGWGLLSKME